MKDIWRRTVLASGAQGYALLVSLAVLSLTARWLGPEGRGQIAAVVAWVTLFSSWGSLSLGQVAIYRAGRLRREPWLGPTLGSLVAVATAASAAGWLVAYIVYQGTGGRAFGGLPPALLFLGFIGLPLWLWEQYGGALLTAVERLDVINRAQVLGRTLVLVAVLAAWSLDGGVASALVATLLGQALVSLSMLVVLWRVAAPPRGADKRVVGELLSGGVRLHWNFAAEAMMASAGILVVNHHLGAEQAGLFHAAVQLVTVTVVIPQAASMVMLGKVAAEGHVEAWHYQRRLLPVLVAVMAVIVVVSAWLAPWLIPMFLGIRFEPAVDIFRVAILSVFGGTLARVMSAQWLGRGLFVPMSAATLFVGVVNLVATLVLVPRGGALGAAWALVIANVAAVGIQLGMVASCERAYLAKRRLSR